MCSPCACKSRCAKTPTATHRVVQRHPVTGREVLFVNEGHTVALLGLEPDEVDALADDGVLS